MADIDAMIEAEIGVLLKGERGKASARASSGSVPESAAGVGEEAILDMVASRLLPAGASDPHRDSKDAGNADVAFTTILASVVAALEAPAVAAHVVATIGTLGGAAVPLTAVHTAILTAAAATRMAWGNLSVQDKARIWRGDMK